MNFFLILGDGSNTGMFDTINDNHIKPCGFIDIPQVYFNISDVYVSASLSEGFSLSVLESLSAGTLLILSDIPSHREVFQLCEDFYIGELFQNSNTLSLQNALNNIRKRIKNTSKNAMVIV